MDKHQSDQNTAKSGIKPVQTKLKLEDWLENHIRELKMKIATSAPDTEDDEDKDESDGKD